MSSTTSGGGRTRVTIVTAVILVAVLLLGAASLTAAPAGTAGAPDATPSAPAEARISPELEKMLLGLARRDAGGGTAVGRVDAPVVLIEYADFQCPYCGKFARDTKPRLMRYVRDGTLRIEWRNVPIFGPESVDAARAGYAAARQGRFWEFYDVVFATERKRNGGDFAPDKLERMAREAGVPDLDRFRTDMRSKAAQEAIDRDSVEAFGIGVTSTPAFLINTRAVLGAQPAEVFESVIEEAKRTAQAATATPSPRGTAG